MKNFFLVFKNPYIGPIFTISIFLVFIIFFIIPKYSYDNQIKALEKQAIDIVNDLKKLRAYYTENIISEVKGNPHIEINYDHKEKKGVLPLPATFLHDLTELLAKDNIEIKLYSNYPFPHRKDRVLSDFQKESLSYLVNNPNQIYSKINSINNQEILNVAVADIFFDQTCVNCHNTRLDSPKTNWKLGDVRGIIKVSAPLQKSLYLSNDEVLILIIVLMSIILLLGVHYSVISILKSKEHLKAKENLENEIDKRTKELQNSLKLLNQYKHAVDSSAIVSKTDKHGKITYVNDEFIKISKYTKEELIGKNHNLVRHEDMPKEIFKDLWKTIKSKNIWKGQIKNKAKDGSEYYVASTIVPILNYEDEIEEYLAIRLDVSDIVKSQLKAKKADDAKSTFLANMSHEIRTPLNAIIGFSDLLSKANDMGTQNRKQAQIINSSAVSLLSIINDILDISKIDSGNFTLSLEESNIVLISEHVVELFSKRANEKHIKLIFNLDPRVPSCIVTDGVRLKQVLSNLLSNAIKFTPNEGKVLLNISLIQLQENKAKIRFEIEDTGIGIAEDKIDTIFNPFIQVDNKSNRQYQGTGLGLSICSHIIKALNSHIYINSVVNKGTKFYFEIDVETCIDNLNYNKNFTSQLSFKIINKNNEVFEHAKQYLNLFGKDIENNSKFDILVYCSNQDMLEQINTIRNDFPNKPTLILLNYEDEIIQLDLNKNEQALALPFYASKLNDSIEELLNKTNKRQIDTDNLDTQYIGNILIAEDNSANQELISYILDGMGVNYTIKENGHEIVNEYKNNSYDLILMDINMPILDGIEAFKLIRKYENEKALDKTPIVALTANAIKGDKERFLDIGMDNYLTKPINVKELKRIFDIYLKFKDDLKKEKRFEKSNIIKNINLDANKISSKLGISDNIANLLINKFKKEIVSDLGQLEDLIEQGKSSEISQKAHYIKNSCLNLCLDEVCILLEELEQEDLNQKQKEKLFYQIEQKIQALY